MEISCQQIYRIWKKNKNNFITLLCKEIPDYTENNEIRELFRMRKPRARRFKLKALAIRNNEGKFKIDFREAAKT